MLPAATRLGPYEIVAPLGAGGMGEVYRARDTRLGREVAVKILPPHFAADPYRVARFALEARAVASLAHPCILVLHDVGDEAGIPYAVTELLAGRTLREQMLKSPLTWRQAAELGAAIASGLAAAHGKGIVHRDLKPENVFLCDDGRPRILDFGIARVTAESAREAAAITQFGALLGTIGYMAPEQIEGSVADARSDLFALGVLLHEAVTGRHPFARDTLAATQLAVLHDDAPSLCATDRTVPPAFDRALQRCLHKDPEERFQTANDLQLTLLALVTGTAVPESVPPDAPTRRRLLLRLWTRATVVAFAGAALTALVYFVGLRRLNSPPTIQSIAVLPLLDQSTDPSAQVLKTGLPRSIIRSLLELPDLTVRPFSSVASYASASEIDAPQVGRQLDVEALLSGSITAHESGPILTVELMEVGRNRSLWLQSYDLRHDPLFIQDDILKELATKLGWQLSAAQRERLARRPTQDTTAYLEYLEGLHAIHEWTVADVKRGIDRLERALARDPAFALAHASLADAYIAAAYIFLQPRVAFEKARQAATEALAKDPLLAEAHAAIATVLFHVDWDWSAAERGFREALRLNPRCAFAHDYFGWYWVARGRADLAIAAVEEAVRLEPRSNLYNVDLAFVYQHGRRFDAAEQQAKRTLALDPQSAMAPWVLSMVHAHRDRDFAAARRQAELFVERDRLRPDGYGMLGWVLGMAGDTAAAHATLERLRRLGSESYVRGEVLAWIHTGLGDKDEAFRQLEQVCDERSPGIVYFKLDPLLDRLRDDPRFAALLQRIGVAD